MFWVLWLGLALIFISSILGVFAWNGNLLEIVKIKTAKKLWLFSVVGLTLGIILFVVSTATILNTPTLLLKLSYTSQNSSPILIWSAVILLLVGGFVIGVPTQLYQLEFTKFSRELRKKMFYVGMVLLVFGVLLWIWLLMPGHQLPT